MIKHNTMITKKVHQSLHYILAISLFINFSRYWNCQRHGMLTLLVLDGAWYTPAHGHLYPDEKCQTINIRNYLY